MIAKVLTKAAQKLTLQEINNFTAGVLSACCDLHIMIYGFYYEPNVGIYTFAPREELTKLNNTNIEDFDVEKYLDETDNYIWLVNWENPNKPELKLYAPPTLNKN